MLKQGRNSPIAVELQVAIIYAVVNDLLLDVPLERIGDFQEALFEHLTAVGDAITAPIRETGNLTEEVEEKLKEAIIYVKNKFLNKV